MQDMQVVPDPFPATVLMVNAMNTNAVLTDLLRQGDIPRLLNQELKNRKPAPKNDDIGSNVDSSSSSRSERRKTADPSSFAKAAPRKQSDPLTPAYDPNAYVPSSGTSRGEKRKEGMAGRLAILIARSRQGIISHAGRRCPPTVASHRRIIDGMCENSNLLVLVHGPV